jgi:hypothetical protein
MFHRTRCNGWTLHLLCGHPWLDYHWPKWFKYFKPQLNLSLNIFIGSFSIWVVIMVMFAMSYLLWVLSILTHFIFIFLSIIFYVVIYFDMPLFMGIIFFCS